MEYINGISFVVELQNMRDFYYLIHNELAAVEKSFVNTFDNKNEIFQAINSFLESPSKRIRSVLGILYLKSQNKEITDEIITVLSAGELIHNASLLHDDVIDKTTVRRNTTTIAKKFSPQISILSGDLLVSVAIQKLIKLDNKKINNIFLNCTEAMSRAEIEQYRNKNRIPNFDTYITICKGKTSALFGAILESASILSGLNIEKALKFAEIFGLVFQIQNDLETKSAETDFKNGIHTIKDIIGIEKTITLIDNYREEMKKIISEFPDNDYKKRLGDLIDRVCLTEKS